MADKEIKRRLAGQLTRVVKVSIDIRQAVFDATPANLE